MGAAELSYLAIVVGTSLAVLTLVTFGLLRRRSPVAWETGATPVGRSTDVPVADPTIARRIAELVPPPSDGGDYADMEDLAVPDGARAETDRGSGADHIRASDYEQLLSDGSDETISDADAAQISWSRAATESIAWPEADPGVARVLLDATRTPASSAVGDGPGAVAAAATAAPTGSSPTIDRESLARLLTDPITGLGTAIAWELWIADEDPRERRYRRPTTIVVGELDGLDAVVAVHGPGVADRAAAMIGTALRANVRTSDHAAVLGPGLYAVLLTETDEVRAVNFVERLRETCEEWLTTNAPGVTIAFGWASPEGDGLAGARTRAHERLLRDRG